MRFVALDSWRGIAALMVAAYHFEATWHGHGASLLANSYLFVDFFFVLSGFVIAHAYGAKINSARDLAAFAVRRFGRLWPLAASVIAASRRLKSVMCPPSLGRVGATPCGDEGSATPGIGNFDVGLILDRGRARLTPCPAPPHGISRVSRRGRLSAPAA